MNAAEFVLMVFLMALTTAVTRSFFFLLAG